MNDKNIPQGPKLTQEEIDKLVRKLLKEKKDVARSTKVNRKKRGGDESNHW